MPPSPSKSSDKSDSSPVRTRPSWLRWLVRITLWITGLAAAAAVGLALTIAVALSVAYPNLPDVSELSNYRPKLPLRVYTADGALIGEFGEERRELERRYGRQTRDKVRAMNLWPRRLPQWIETDEPTV